MTLRRAFLKKILVWATAILAAAVMGSLVPGLVLSAQEDAGYFRQIRAIETADIGIPSPAGLAFVPGENAFLVLGASEKGRTGSQGVEVSLVTLFGEHLAGTVKLETGISEPRNVAFDQRTNSLYVLDSSTKELIQIPAGSNGKLDPSARVGARYDMRALGLGHIQGMAFDPASGQLFLLDSTDSAGPAIVTITPDAELGFDGLTAVRNGRVQRRSPKALAGGQAAGLALDPGSGHLFVLNPPRRQLVELAQSGRVIAVYDLSSISLTDPQGMVFAPSGDPTDDPAIMDLYIADRGRSSGLEPLNGQIVELSFVAPQAAPLPQAPLPSSLINLIDTSKWSPASPDPAGVIYRSSSDTLLVSDSEVNEMSIFTGKNLYESTLGGSLLASFSTLSFSDEPTGLAINPDIGHLFVSDDTQIGHIYEVAPGADGIYGTNDDTVNSINTEAFGSFDPEDVAFGLGVLYVLDGVGEEVYRVYAGRNGVFDGVPPTGDDEVTSFDTTILGARDPEGIDYNPDNNTLFIASRIDDIVLETTSEGSVLNFIDITFLNAISPSGIAYAPSGINPGQMSLYISDRGIDNGADPRENDGKIYEISYSGGMTAPTPTPSITNTPTLTPTPGPSPTPPPVPQVVEVRVSTSSDDAEESDVGALYLTSSDLELTLTNGYYQTVGIRFTGVAIPQGAQIGHAYLQFKVDETSSVATALTLQGQAADNAPTFSATMANISARPRTAAAIPWNPPPWTTVGEVGLAQRTPDISPVIQEIASRPGWSSGNSLVIIITGTGVRIAEAFDGDAAGAPLLHVELNTGSGGPTPTATATNMPTPTATDTPLPTNTPTASATPTGTLAATSTPTGSPLPPTSTPTATPSNTPLPPADTPTATPTNTSTATSTPTPTQTPVSSGPNLALNQPVTVSTFQDASHAGPYAVDGDVATYWQSRKAVGRKAQPDEWIMVDLGSSLPLNRVVLEWRDFYATSYRIEVSNDNSNWTSVYTMTAGDGARDEALFSETTARYLKVVTTSWTSVSWRNWLGELQVYGPGGP